MPDSETTSLSDEDPLIATLERESESDPNLAALRESRITALSARLSHAQSQRQHGFGTYHTCNSEQEVFAITTTAAAASPRCVVHFFKSDFQRCGIMDRHLLALADRHLEARFLRVDVMLVPFLVNRLAVKVLPCVIAFVAGVERGRLVGFEGLEGGDACTTGELERWLLRRAVLDSVVVGFEGVGKAQEGGRGDGGWEGRVKKEEEEEEDSDWD